MPIFQLSEKAANRLAALDDAAFISVCYGVLLNRAPDVQGYEWHLENLRNGMPRTDVLASFLSSEEHQICHGGNSSSISMFLEAGGALDFSARDFLNSVAARVHTSRINLLPDKLSR